ncbi:uncharacterized protein PRCAT00004210001 [Priceomyces carsonii]|uniref:uncharacterized protein n=1 Tax=Priceomyces carsonii TaxID=28549 RepID=UPI002EDA1F2E|nr:unnamed protein product [Priceomyces carsonii]
MKIVNKLLDLAIIVTVLFHLLVSPFTKVEESFNIQAIHDIINYGVYPRELVSQNYDHVEFPGSVPRTFVGSLVLSGFSKIVTTVLGSLGPYGYDKISQIELQILARAILGLLNVLMLIKFGNSLQYLGARRSGFKRKINVAFWYRIFLLTQFHLLYYSSRTLPNFIALPLVLFGLASFLKGNLSGLVWMAFTGIVFRLEVGVFGVIIALVSSLMFKHSQLFVSVLMLVVGTLMGLAITFPIDSYFWNRPVIPEISSFVFNIVDGKSSEWGVEPWSAYFTHYIWKLFRLPLIPILLLPGLYCDPSYDGVNTKKKNAVTHPARNSLRILSISSLLFIVVMSFQPHKEWRFIMYTIPVFTLQAANGMDFIMSIEAGFIRRKLFVMTIFLVSLIGIASSLFMGYISSYNYPGGKALVSLNEYIETHSLKDPVVVHMDVAACMTGVSRFGEIHNDLVAYDKTENITALAKVSDTFDFLISEVKLDEINSNDISEVYRNEDWDLLFTTEGYRGFNKLLVLNLIRQAQKDKANTLEYIEQLVRDPLDVHVENLKSFLKSLVLTQDYLFIYKRARDVSPTS